MTEKTTQESINANDILYIKSALTRIETQVLSTNGRVTSLEKWKYGLLCAVTTLAATKWPVIGMIMEQLK